MVQLSQPYVTTEKTIALTIWTFAGRVMSLLFNTLSRFVIAFLLRSNRLPVSWLQSPFAVILELEKRKSITTSTLSSSVCCEVMGPDLSFLKYFLKPALSLSSFCCHQFSSVAQLCPTLCDPMNCSTPGLPVHHKLLEFTQTHIHWVGDAIQPSHPLSSPSPPAPNPSKHQSLFQWVNSSHEVAKVLEFQL